MNPPLSTDSASRPITGSTSATLGFSVRACFAASSVAARQTSPSAPCTDSAAMVSALFSSASAFTGPASRLAVAAVNAASACWSSARTPWVTT